MNPYRLPDHIVGLLKERLLKEEVDDMIHDAFLEIGLPLCAWHYSVNNKEHHRGDICNFSIALLNGTTLRGFEEGLQNEVDEYSKKMGVIS